MHLWKSGRIGSLEVKGDCVLGHEAAGIVLKVGEGVTSLKVGKLLMINALALIVENTLTSRLSRRQSGHRAPRALRAMLPVHGRPV